MKRESPQKFEPRAIKEKIMFFPDRYIFLILFALISVAIILGSDSVFSQQVEVFRGSILRNTFGAGVLVSATKRSNGDEVLRIRANSHTAQAFIPAKLPTLTEGKPYGFTLMIGPPSVVQKTCSRFPDTPAEFDDCFMTKAKQPFEGWDAFELEQVDAEIKQIGLRSKSVPAVYGRCGYVPSHKMLLSCDFIFEQGGHRHELNTSAIALKNIDLFRCAALTLRNAIWTGAPAFAQLCR